MRYEKQANIHKAFLVLVVRSCARDSKRDEKVMLSREVTRARTFDGSMVNPTFDHVLLRTENHWL